MAAEALQALVTSPLNGKTPVEAKARKAAQDFEAILLHTLLRPLEHALSALPGGEGQADDAYQSLGTEALAQQIAAAGGLGIAAALMPSLLRSPGAPSVSPQAGKVLPEPADIPVSGTSIREQR